MVNEFCLGRGAKYPLELLKGWPGTLVCDCYGWYYQVLKTETRIEEACMVHARRKFDKLNRDNLSPVAATNSRTHHPSPITINVLRQAALRRIVIMFVHELIMSPLWASD